ncbi:hypothetical protein AB0O91_21885 [Kitasatospora sp. NPDC089797]|uniref:hypothetical protein n=1 Tax=Kitasatospora sp. NPDC089797 TaxID=3155298 RepID=UPI00341DEAA1
MSTFAALIQRYADDVAYLAAGLTGTPEPAASLTPEQFAQLVQDAADELEAHAGLGLYPDSDDLDEAAARLRAALASGPAAQRDLLDQAARLLEAAEFAANEIRLAS